MSLPPSVSCESVRKSIQKSDEISCVWTLLLTVDVITYQEVCQYNPHLIVSKLLTWRGGHVDLCLFRRRYIRKAVRCPRRDDHHAALRSINCPFWYRELNCT